VEILVILLPIALVLGGAFLGFFFWAVARGQYDDVETPRYRMLLDESTGPQDRKKGKEL
jgi:cbb3-type cytochrome oxidase maturation protein